MSRRDYKDKTWSGYGRPYQYWSGSWHGRWNKPEKKEKSKPVIGSYMDAKPNMEDNVPKLQTPAKEEKLPTEHGGDFLRALQKQITTARKAETKARKLQEELLQRHEKWQQFEEDIRTAFKKERMKYNTDIQKLEEDLKDALESAEEAQILLRSVAKSGAPCGSSTVPEDMDVDQKSKDNEAWDTLIAGRDAEEEKSDNETIQRWLKQALEASRSDVDRARTKVREAQANKDASEPQSPGRAGEPSTASASTGPYTSTSPTITDPYLGSPIPMATGRPGTERTTTTPRLRHKQQNAVGVRQPIKLASKPSGRVHSISPRHPGLSLAQKLDQKRGIGEGGQKGVMMSTILIDDDPDLVSQPEPLTPTELTTLE